MRFNRLDLITYGKFENHSLALPRAERDFHLVIGVNEAGKSTTRKGINELLFGMPKITTMDFRFDKADLRLGAEIHGHDGSVLEFTRDRTKQSLKSSAGEVLPLDALLPYLGGTTDKFFLKVFCLDMESLIAGGKSILDASDEVGQLLFQSAAGINSLGAVRASLEAEADKLFGPRKSDREVYQALEQYNAAKSALKEITVNTKAWLAASNEVEELREALRALDDTRSQRVTETGRLQRIRRLAALVASLHDTRSQLDQLGDGPVFDPGAGDVLAAGLLALSANNATVEHQQARVNDIEEAMGALVLDSDILALRAPIDLLARSADDAINQRRDLADCQDDVAAEVRVVCEAAAQIGWPTQEQKLREHVPTALALKTVTGLIASRGAKAQRKASDAETQANAERTLKRLQDRRALPSVEPVSRAFEDALRKAQDLGQAKARIAQHERAVRDAKQTRDAAFDALGAYKKSHEDLAAMNLPTVERVNGFRSKRSRLEAEVAAAKKVVSSATSAHAAAALKCAQYERSNETVLMEDVFGARLARDAAWSSIKTKTVSVDAGAQAVDLAIAKADTLVDKQRDTATLSAGFQSAKNDLELRQQELDAGTAVVDEAQLALDDYDDNWAKGCEDVGLPGLHLDDALTWFAKREAALAAAASLALKQEALDAESVNETDAVDGLLAVLRPLKLDLGDSQSLESLLEVAVAHREASVAAASERQQLDDQISAAEADLDDSRLRAAASEAELSAWQDSWTAALAAARLDPAIATDDAVTGVVEVANDVLMRLANISKERTTRIDRMQAALDAFQTSAEAACMSLGAPLGDSDAVAMAATLKDRLSKALGVEAELKRHRSELQGAKKALEDAKAALELAKAGLSTIYTTAGTQDENELRRLIGNSERRAALAKALGETRAKIMEGSDGLDLEAVEAEVAATSVSTAEARLGVLADEDRAEQQLRDGLASRLALAEQQLGKIVGGSDAAVAESKKNEALALMTESAERYIKVASAAKVLSWVIERYRERKQGPLLSRAGELFKDLTNGNYDRLAADFEGSSPRLTAVRGTDRVNVEALSDGTRDQLFLALRLAALEMHIGNNRALPFVADDLLVNYDDARVEAGFRVLAELSRKTQVIFLTHHDHMVPIAQRVLGADLNVVRLQ